VCRCVSCGTMDFCISHDHFCVFFSVCDVGDRFETGRFLVSSIEAHRTANIVGDVVEHQARF
jgi:hypothetical protein